MARGNCCPQCGVQIADRSISGLCPICLGQLVLQEAKDPWSAEAEVLGEDEPKFTPSQGRFPRCFGDYEILEEVACGGMGIVYRARQGGLNRIVALKMILAPRVADPKTIHRFRMEAEAAAQLQHPNIVAIHEIGEFEGQQYYTMDFVEGQNLAQLSGGNTLPATRAASYVKTIAEAIHYAHQRGILHRDLKPSNILIDQNDQPRVTDFGLAKLMFNEAELTLSGQAVGSPSYMAPEQAEGRTRDISARSDVYSLGAMLYELVTGQPPFRAESTLATLKQVLEMMPVSPRLLHDRVPLDIATICLKCLEKDAARRYGSAEELADELGRFLRQEPIQARPTGLPERIRQWCRRNPRLAGAVGAAGLAVVVGFAGVVWQWRLAEVHRERAEREQRAARQHSYAADLYAAQRAYEQQNWGLVRQLLSAHRPAIGEDDLRGFEWRWLWHQVQGDQMAVLPGHTNVITALAFSPDSRWLASAGHADCLLVWDVQERRTMVVLPGSTNHIFGLAFSPDGRQLAVGANEGVELWDTGSWQVLRKIPAFAASVAFAPSNSLVAFGQRCCPWGSGQGGAVELWDAVRGEMVLHLPNAGSRVAFAPDGRTLVAGDVDDSLSVWELPQGRCLRTLPHGFRLLALEFSPDGRYLGTVQWDDGPRLWSARDWTHLGPLVGHTNRVRSLAFSPDSRFVATAGSDQTVDLWDPATRNRLVQLRGHSQEIWSLAFAPNGRLLASGGREGGVFLWDLSATPVSSCLTGLDGFLGAPIFALSPDGARVAGRTAEGIGVWDTAHPEQKGALLPGVVPLAFLPDGNRLLTLGPPAILSSWDLSTTQLISRIELATPPLGVANDAHLSPTGRWLALGSGNGTLTLIDTRTGGAIAGPRPHRGYVLALDFSRDEHWLASSDLSGDAFLWELPDLRLHGRFRGHQDYVRGLAISPDGTRLATASADGTSRLWSLPEGRELTRFLGHHEDVIDCAFSPDGQTLATSSYDLTVRLWDLRTFREMLTLPHQDHLLRIQFSANGQLLATLSHDGTLRFWRAPAP